MIHSVESTNDTAQRLSQRAVVIGIGVIGQQAVFQQRLDGHVAILGITATELIGIAGSHLRTLVVMSRLNNELIADLILMLPVFAHFDDITAELMTHDSGSQIASVGDALMLTALQRCLIAGHAKAVGNDADTNTVGTNLRQVHLVQA